MVQCDGVMAFLWRDNRVVTVLSTNAQPQEQEVVQRRENDGHRVDVSCPAAMALYQICTWEGWIEMTSCGSIIT